MKFYVPMLYDRVGTMRGAGMLVVQFPGIEAGSEEEAREKLFSQIVRLEFQELTEAERSAYERQ